MQVIHETICELTAAFYSAFTNIDGPAAVDVLYEICIPQALVINATGEVPAIYDLRAFIEPRRDLLASGALTAFREYEVAGSTEVFGSIAHRQSRYKKTWIDRGSHMEGSGTKIFSFVHMPQGWRIASVLWYDGVSGDHRLATE